MAKKVFHQGIKYVRKLCDEKIGGGVCLWNGLIKKNLQLENSVRVVCLFIYCRK